METIEKYEMFSKENWGLSNDDISIYIYIYKHIYNMLCVCVCVCVCACVCVIVKCAVYSLVN